MINNNNKNSIEIKKNNSGFISYDEAVKLTNMFFRNIKIGSGVKDESFIEIFCTIKYLKANFIKEINKEYQMNNVLTIEKLNNRLSALKSKIWNIITPFEDRFCVSKRIKIKDLTVLGYIPIDRNNEPCLIDLNKMQKELFKYYKIFLKKNLENIVKDKKYNGISKKTKKEVIDNLSNLLLPLKVVKDRLDKELNEISISDKKTTIYDDYNLLYNKLLIEMNKYLLNIIKIGNSDIKKIYLTENIIKENINKYLINDENNSEIKEKFMEMKSLYIQTKKINKMLMESRNNPFDKMVDYVTRFIIVDDYLKIKCLEVKNIYIMIFQQLNDVKSNLENKFNSEEINEEFLLEFSEFMKNLVIKAINSIEIEFCKNHGIEIDDLDKLGYKSINEYTKECYQDDYLRIYSFKKNNIKLNQIDNNLYSKYKIMIMRRIKSMLEEDTDLSKINYEEVLKNFLDYKYNDINEAITDSKKHIKLQ